MEEPGPKYCHKVIIHGTNCIYLRQFAITFLITKQKAQCLPHISLLNENLGPKEL